MELTAQYVKARWRRLTLSLVMAVGLVGYVWVGSAYQTKLSLIHVCPHITAPAAWMDTNMSFVDRWQTVTHGGMYMYSAHYDDRQTGRHQVVVIGMSTKQSADVWCQLWFHNTNSSVVFKATWQIVPEHHYKKYFPTLHYCSISTQRERQERPYAVSLVSDMCQQSHGYLPIHHHPPPDTLPDQQRNFTVCLSVLHSNYSNHNQFISTIETNRIFGADHIVVYDYSVSSQFKPYLQYYKQEGIISVLPWDIPVQVNECDCDKSEVHYFGQVVALNDCLFRNMFTSQYLVITDIDEFIVPQQWNTWQQMLRHITDKDDFAWTAQWKFQNGIFITEGLNNDESAGQEAEELNILPLLKTWRESELMPPTLRTKVIIRPRLVQQAGIHWSWKFLPGALQQEVDPGSGLLHHYKKQTLHYVINKTVLKYKDRLIDSVKRVRAKMQL